MNVQIHAKGVTLSAAVRAHIEAAVESFEKYQLEMTTVNVNIAAEKQGVAIEFDIHIAHAQPVVINQSDKDLDTAIDLAIERASKALRRLHDKVVSKKASSVRDLEALEVE
jgi:putative sigma-54 modulation protein